MSEPNITHNITTRPKQGAMGCASIIGVLLLFVALGTATTYGLRFLGLTKDKLEVRESSVDRELNSKVESKVEKDSINNNEIVNINIKLNNENIKVKCKVNNKNNNEDDKINVECDSISEVEEIRPNRNIHRYSSNNECNMLNGDRCWYLFGR